MNSTTLIAAAAALGSCALLAASGAQALPVGGTGNVTPDVIFGSGNANGGFSGIQANGLEIGLRGKLRYNTSGAPENTFNYDGGRLYEFEVADTNAPAGLAAWTFEFSINSDFENGSRALNAFQYNLMLDIDPTAGANFVSLGDVINSPLHPSGFTYADHAFGDNATGNGGGTVVARKPGNVVDADVESDYLATVASANVVQQSWNYGFFTAILNIDPQTQGLFSVRLDAYGNAQLAASTSIDVRFGEVPAPETQAVPLPAALPLMAAGLLGLGAVARRRRRV